MSVVLEDPTVLELGEQLQPFGLQALDLGVDLLEALLDPSVGQVSELGLVPRVLLHGEHGCDATTAAPEEP